METRKAVETYNTLNTAKLTKMEDKDKFLVIKAMRQLKPIATAYEDFAKDAQEKLKGEDFDTIRKQAQQWQEEGESTTLTLDERRHINLYLNDYNAKVAECLKEEAAKDSPTTFERLSEEAFGKLIASNDWTVETIMKLHEALV